MAILSDYIERRKTVKAVRLLESNSVKILTLIQTLKPDAEIVDESFAPPCIRIPRGNGKHTDIHYGHWIVRKPDGTFTHLSNIRFVTDWELDI